MFHFISVLTLKNITICIFYNYIIFLTINPDLTERLQFVYYTIRVLARNALALNQMTR